MIDWPTVGLGLAGIVTGVGAYVAGRSKRTVDNAQNAAETNVIELMRSEIARLSVRLTAMEGREGRLIRHVYRLEGLMRATGIEPPPFEIDGLPGTQG